MPNTLTTNPADLLLNDTAEFDAMLGNPPTWMMRFGVWAIFGGVLFLFSMAWFVKCLDIHPRHREPA